MTELSEEAKREIEKMALKATEKIMDGAVEIFKIALSAGEKTMDASTAAAHNALIESVQLHSRAVARVLDEPQ